MIRVFVGLGFSHSIAQRISELRNQIRCRSARWVEPANYHLTIAFVGSLDEGVVPQFRQILDAAATAVDSFFLNISGVGSFKSRKGRTLYAAVTDPPGELYELSRRIRSAFDDHDVAYDRKKLVPHITLARNAQDVQISESAHRDPVRAHIGEVILYRSDQSPSGIRYSRVTTAAFHEREAPE